MASFGQLLRQLRTGATLTQEELAQAATLSTPSPSATWNAASGRCSARLLSRRARSALRTAPDGSRGPREQQATPAGDRTQPIFPASQIRKQGQGDAHRISLEAPRLPENPSAPASVRWRRGWRC
jgi:transcriptional regulator with XRE-family HTH domain